MEFCGRGPSMVSKCLYKVCGWSWVLVDTIWCVCGRACCSLEENVGVVQSMVGWGRGATLVSREARVSVEKKRVVRVCLRATRAALHHCASRMVSDGASECCIFECMPLNTNTPSSMETGSCCSYPCCVSPLSSGHVMVLHLVRRLHTNPTHSLWID